MKENTRGLLRISFLGHIFNDMYWFIIPLMLPMMKSDLNLNYTRSGLLLSSYIIMGAVGSLVTGYLGDKVGRKSILSWGFVIGSFALILAALSQAYWQLLLALVLLGMGISTFHPSMIAVLSTKYVHKRGATLGLFQFWGWVGTLAVVIMVALLTRGEFGWRFILPVLSLPGFVFGPLFFLILGKMPLEAAHPSQSGNNEVHSAVEEEVKRVTVLPFILFMSAITLFTMSLYAVLNFIPTYLVESKSLSVTVSSYSFVIVVAGALMGTIASGKAADRFSPLGALLLFVGLGGPVIIVLTLISGLPLLLVFLVLFGIAYSGVYAPQQSHLADETPHRSRGGFYGLIFCVGYIVGAIAPGLTGIAADLFGLSRALQFSSLPLFASLVPLLYLMHMRAQLTGRSSHGRQSGHNGAPLQ